MYGAFTEAERDLIVITSVKTGTYTTNDKIFLLSKQELDEYDYYFRYNQNREVKQIISTDYSYYQMSPLVKYEKDGYWWLRSSYEEDAFSAYVVSSSGESIEYYDVCWLPMGIIPALCL